MAKVLGPDFISLQVRDFSVYRAFYTETLGMEAGTLDSTVPASFYSIPALYPSLWPKRR